MRILKLGSIGPGVEFLQLALERARFYTGDTDGIFGTATDGALRAFQRRYGLVPDGVCGAATHKRLMPWYTGFLLHRVQRGDSLASVARLYGAALPALLAANPGYTPENLPLGAELTVPLPFQLVPETISCFSFLLECCVKGLSARYPFLVSGSIGKSAMGKPLWFLRFGQGENRVLYNAAHHANEWICTLVLLKFTEQLCAAYAVDGLINGQSARELFNYASVYLVPAVNPDGMDLSTGELQQGSYYSRALELSRRYPQYPFPSGWKANLQGIDLNLQYPAGWEQARENKFAQGIVSPSPGDFVGDYPLQAPESLAMYDYTLRLRPALVLAYHTQGQVIYWRYLDYEIPGAAEIAAAFSQASGYTAEDTPYASGFAGYKDWFIKDFRRPGFTVEAGLGQNPLPISQFPHIYRDNLGILTLAALVT